MAAKSNPNTALHGANVERDCIRRKIRRIQRTPKIKTTTEVLDDLLKWIDDRSLRYERKAGGLGTKRERG